MIFISRWLIVVDFLPWNFLTAQQRMKGWRFSPKSPKCMRNWNLLQGCSTLSQQIQWVTRSSETKCNKCFCLDLPKDLNANRTAGKLGWTLVAASPSGFWFFWFFFFFLQSWWNSLQLHLNWGCDLNFPKQAGQVWKPDISQCVCFLRTKVVAEPSPRGAWLVPSPPWHVCCHTGHWIPGKSSRLAPYSQAAPHSNMPLLSLKVFTVYFLVLL